MIEPKNVFLEISTAPIVFIEDGKVIVNKIEINKFITQMNPDEEYKKWLRDIVNFHVWLAIGDNK